MQLARFWRKALGYEHIEVPQEVEEAASAAIERGELEADAWAMLVNPDGTGPRLLFQRRPKTPTTDIPIHLDLHSDDRAAEVERLTGLGATFVEERSLKIGPYEEFWTVMKDPEGNGFCVS